MYIKKSRHQLTAILTLLISLNTLATSSAEASVCKGLSKSTCESSQECRWIDGYKRKDGRPIKGYCRIQKTNKTRAEEPKTNQTSYRNYEYKWLREESASKDDIRKNKEK